MAENENSNSEYACCTIDPENGTVNFNATTSILLEVGSSSVLIEDGMVTLKSKSVSSGYPMNIFDSTLCVDGSCGISVVSPDVGFKSFGCTMAADSFGGGFSISMGRSTVTGSSVSLSANNVLKQSAALSTLGSVISETFNSIAENRGDNETAAAASTTLFSMSDYLHLFEDLIGDFSNRGSVSGIVTLCADAASYSIEIVEWLLNLTMSIADMVDTSTTDDDMKDDIEDYEYGASVTISILNMLDKISLIIAAAPTYVDVFANPVPPGITMDGRYLKFSAAEEEFTSVFTEEGGNKAAGADTGENK